MRKECVKSGKLKRGELLCRDTVYLVDALSQEAALKEVACDLKKKNLVKDGFLESLLKREKQYPTGMDMSCVDPKLPNFAVPHTEADLVMTTRIVPVRLLTPLAWHTMLDPTKTCTISFYFMILNDDPKEQTNVLARIMDFVMSSTVEKICQIFARDNSFDLYRDLSAYF